MVGEIELRDWIEFDKVGGCLFVKINQHICYHRSDQGGSFLEHINTGY